MRNQPRLYEHIEADAANTHHLLEVFKGPGTYMMYNEFDLLVMTGSGFPYIAAVTSWKPVVVRGPIKEGETALFQHNDWIRVNVKGGYGGRAERSHWASPNLLMTNADEDGTGILHKRAILRGYCRGDDEWFVKNIPFLDCPDQCLLDTFYYRWWTYKKNTLWNSGSNGWVVNEGGGYGITCCPLGHHFYEGRWLKDTSILNDNASYWLSYDTNSRVYANWLADALWAKYLVDHDQESIISRLDALQSNYGAWEQERFDSSKGLFKWIPDRDGMEGSVACWEQAARTKKYDDHTIFFGGEGYRPSLNSYMWADAVAIAKVAELAGNFSVMESFRIRADLLRCVILSELWSPDKRCFLQRISHDYSFISGREQIMYFPWSFHLPPDTAEYVQCWDILLSEQGFAARYGPTTLERRNEFYMRPYDHPSMWNGPSWPFSTTLTLRGMANVLLDYKETGVLTPAVYQQALSTYSDTQRDPDGSCMVREDHDPIKNTWIAKGANYNHSAFCDLVITGLLGIRPQADDTLVIQPTLVPTSWHYFCLEDLPYHCHLITILYDKTGLKYKRGAGFKVIIDGTTCFEAPTIVPVTIPLRPSASIAGVQEAASLARSEEPSGSHPLRHLSSQAVNEPEGEAGGCWARLWAILFRCRRREPAHQMATYDMGGAVVV